MAAPHKNLANYGTTKMNCQIDENSGQMTIRPKGAVIECGFEIGDWLSYLSAGRDATKATATVVESDITPDRMSLSHRIRLEMGTFELTQTERINGNTIIREFDVLPLESGFLGDFVGRFSFPDCGDAVVSIDGRNIEHTNKNRYHQYHTDRVSLSGNFGRFVVETTKAELPDGMEYVMYARDEPPDNWVIHARVLACDTGIGVLRFHRGPFTHSQALDRIISRSSLIAGRFRRLRERTRLPSRYIPIQYGDLTPLATTDDIQLGLKCKYYDEQ